MDTSTPTAPVAKRRNGSVILTDRMCEKRVLKRVKIYDRKCPGLHVSITTAGQAAKQGKTLDEIIAERIKWMKTEVPKRDGKLLPRKESWKNVASHLRRFLSPRLGKLSGNEVTKADIIQRSNDIVAGKFGKPSVSNARHFRRAASGLFGWALDLGYVNANPCSNMPDKLFDAEYPRRRVLSEQEIKALWIGLDRADLPYDRKVKIGLKLALCTMLRSVELIGADRSELAGLNGEQARINVPWWRVKKSGTSASRCPIWPFS
jgi:integrase